MFIRKSEYYSLNIRVRKIMLIIKVFFTLDISWLTVLKSKSTSLAAW